MVGPTFNPKIFRHFTGNSHFIDGIIGADLYHSSQYFGTNQGLVKSTY